MKQFGLERVTLWVGESLDEPAGRRGGDKLGMDEAVVVRRDLDMVEFTQRRHLPALGEAPEHGHVELQNLNGLFLNDSAAAVAGQFAFSGRQRNLCSLR